nr:hypothetical protein [uncultured Mediterranean phage uvMED]BAR25520.1 hypothetical protein [uncultured Mediterranean phage uvMED]
MSLNQLNLKMCTYKIEYYDRDYKVQTLCVTATNSWDARNEAFHTMPFLRMYPSRVYSVTLYEDQLHKSDGSIH